MKEALSDLRDRLRAEARESPQPKTPPQAKAGGNKLKVKVRSEGAGRAKVDQRTYDERMALLRAYQGVEPLKGEQRRPAKLPMLEAERAQTSAAVREEAFRPIERMVAEGVRFVVEDDALTGLRAYRASRGKQALEPLKAGKAKPEAALDLHGFREEPAREMLQRWLRSERERGRRVVLVVHGQGHHSAGSAVLKEAVYDELRSGISAAFVEAFMTAAQSQGGQGATLVALRPRR